MTFESTVNLTQALTRATTRPKETPQQQGSTAAAIPTRPVSVLIPCCGQLEYTKLCVVSLLQHSRAPYELVFLDIGSLDGTSEYLAGLAAAASVRVEVIRTLTDLGVPTAIQEAVNRARGEFLVLLNNDTIVTEGWLEQLVALARAAPGIGLVGPMSNYASPPQLVEQVPYRIRLKGPGPPAADGLVGDLHFEVDALDRFAQEFRAEHRGQWSSVDRLGGFCLLVKREVLARVGPLPDQSGLGIFDTEALCLKAQQAGYSLACCRDLYIHHFGSRVLARGGPPSTARGGTDAHSLAARTER